MIEKLVSEFFEKDLPDYAAYDGTRKICSSVDGLKISMRKIIYTMMNKYPCKDKIKTDTVANTTAAYTNYLHGANNLCGVVDTMTQCFTSANNYALLEGNSSGFGTRINPQCSAPRYTKVALSPIVESLFNKDDLQIVEKQFFEGSYIEPKYFVPTFPVLFLNGSHGLSTGFSQDIFPRDPKEIIKYIKAHLDGKEANVNLFPWFRGFTGSIRVNANTGKTECLGVIVKNNMNSYTITEIPIGIEYQKYIEILNKLCDDNVIVDYEDLCDTKTDTIKFELKTTREFTRKYDSEEKLMTVLKLIKTLPETLCCIDSNNKVKEYNNIEEILNDFIELREAFYEKRKSYQIEQIVDKLSVLNSKKAFCKAIINDELIIAKRKKSDIVKDLTNMPSIAQVDGSYNYLLNMPIHSISSDTIDTLEKDIAALELKYEEISKMSVKDMWVTDLNELEKFL